MWPNPQFPSFIFGAVKIRKLEIRKTFSLSSRNIPYRHITEYKKFHHLKFIGKKHRIYVYILGLLSRHMLLNAFLIFLGYTEFIYDGGPYPIETSPLIW